MILVQSLALSDSRALPGNHTREGVVGEAAGAQSPGRAFRFTGQSP